MPHQQLAALYAAGSQRPGWVAARQAKRRHAAACLIQAVWRGWRVRQRFKAGHYTTAPRTRQLTVTGEGPRLSVHERRMRAPTSEAPLSPIKPAAPPSTTLDPKPQQPVAASKATSKQEKGASEAEVLRRELEAERERALALQRQLDEQKQCCCVM
eukprot:gnl/Hemi2/12443_TR4242_c0_g10_i1.p2 gnl/Hemi2/12443_TR4242_c0_g10~~gnl/Hemi2/12443_TR4242_c0_g10_i1.p2  ORF type:complete len:156 (-),score=46.25 gnl/Hemi2/12443_TR4242_c0_g10_i1:149-616(-)